MKSIILKSGDSWDKYLPEQRIYDRVSGSSDIALEYNSNEVLQNRIEIHVAGVAYPTIRRRRKL